MSHESAEFWRIFRQLQPDVEIVLVPEESPDPRGPALDRDAAAERAAEASKVADELVESCPLTVEQRLDGWQRHEEGGFTFTVVVWGAEDASQAAARERFDAVADRISSAGWTAVSPPTPVPWLRATHPDVDLSTDLSVDGTRLRLEVATGPMHLGEEPW